VGQTSCNGVCRDLDNDRFNCGQCGRVCQGPVGAVGCVAGQCTCGTGLTLCGSSCVNLAFDRNNCGSCGTVCPSNLTCINSVCTTP
jgi:hypothetical protein